MTKRLEALRESRGMKISELAVLSGVSINAIKAIERGQARPYWRTVVKIAHALGCDLHELDGYDRPELKICVICGKEFEDSPSNPNKTCRDGECSKVHRQNLYKEGKYDRSIERMHKNISVSPLTGPFETHQHAKSWVIVSPDGTRYSCRNLSLWAREHEDILPGTVSQFTRSIRKIKQSYLGKALNPCYHYKGWALESWEDC